MRTALFAALAFSFATAAFAQDCPKSGYHLGKDTHGQERCIRNGVMTCPKGFTQMDIVMGTWECVSQIPLKPGQSCKGAETEVTDKKNLRRCQMTNFDKCPEGFSVQPIGGGKFSCMK
jgi:hypothetical protein